MTEGSPEGLDVDQFLKDNELSHLKDLFVEKQVSPEELADFNNTELMAFAKDLQLNEEQTSRFISAIRKIKPMKSTMTSTVSGESSIGTSLNKRSSMASGNVDLVHLIISPQEHEAITKLHERFDKTNVLLKDLESSFDTLTKKNGDICQQDIVTRMELVYKHIDECQNKLFEAVDSMSTLKTQRLEQQLDLLKTYRAEINQGKNKYQELIDDPSLDVQYRKKQVVGMVDQLLERPEIPLLMVTQPKKEFGWTDQYLNMLLSHIILNDCDQPFSPHVMVTAIRYSSAVLQVSVVMGDLGRDVLEFGVEYAVLPTEEDTKLKSQHPSSFRDPSIGVEQPRQSQASSRLSATSKKKIEKKKQGFFR